MSPYPDLKTPISLQSWGYQLFVTSATTRASSSSSRAEVQPEDDAGVPRDLLAADVQGAPEHVRAPAWRSPRRDQ